MGATGGDISSAGMAAAIEANIVETSSLFGRVPGTELHDEDPDLRFYVTAGVPSPLFNHVYLTRLPQEKPDARGSRRPAVTTRRAGSPLCGRWARLAVRRTSVRG